VSPVKYELGFYNPEDDILHSHRRESLKCCIVEDNSQSAMHKDLSYGTILASKHQRKLECLSAGQR
jgi:hypothetical protein